MTAQDVLDALGAPDRIDDVNKHWDESMAAMPAETPPFLQESQCRTNARWCGFTPDAEDALARVAARMAGDPALRRLAWHCYWRVYLNATPAPLADWPELTDYLDQDAGLFYLVVGVAFAALMREHHARLGIPENVTRETAQQPRRYCDDTYRPVHNGQPGIHLGQLGWLRHYTRERYVRLGRLEFWLGPNPHAIRVYRNRITGRVIALAAPGTRFAPDGSIFRDPGDCPGDDAWDAVWQEDANSVTGTVITPHGKGTRQVLTLTHQDWDAVLRKGDTSLMLHIPSGGKMTPEACRDSFQRAAAFFAKYFPDEPANAVVCASWIFSNQLQKIFPPDANLVRFQKELYLFPVPSGPWDGLWFVFLQRGELDAETAPRKTALQREILSFIEAGNRWHCGGMFFLLTDVAQFGNQVYTSSRT